MNVSIQNTDALIVVDIQNDFLPGGALAVAEGNRIIPAVNQLMGSFSHAGGRIVLTQDWHPSNHLSFASQHEGRNPFDTIEGIFGIGPVLWPDHCVQETSGADFGPKLATGLAHLIIRKGINPKMDSYSAFTENDGKSDTGLAGYFENIGVKRIFLCGLALDYCVFWSAMDGVRKGFETIVVPELCKGIAAETVQSAEKEMVEKGVHLLTPQDFE